MTDTTRTDSWESALTAPFSRRSFLSVLGLGAATAGLAACGSSSSSSKTNSKTTSSTAGKIAATTFVDVRDSIPTSFDPANGFSGANVYLQPEWCSTLVARRGKPVASTSVATSADVVPYLAKSWVSNSDGSYTFTLRDGVKSAAGNPLTTADVKYSFDRIVAIDFAGYAALAQGNISFTNPITVLSPTTFKLNVTAPSSNTLGALTWFAGGILDSKLMKSKATASDKWSTKFYAKNSATFAAYSVTAFTPGSSITLTANPHHFAPVHFTSVTIKAVSDASSRLQLMLSGQASHTTGLEWSQFSAAQKQGPSKGVQATTLHTSAMQYLLLSEKYAPLKNKLVRQALSIGIDRDAIAKAIFYGNVKPALYPVPSSIPLPFTPSPISYDPGKAKKLLAQAGYPKGFSLELAANPSGTGSFVSAASSAPSLVRSTPKRNVTSPPASLPSGL